jgi:hypothetical protein
MATLYKALIENDDGIRVFQREITDPDAEYEAFEIFCNNKADELNGEIFGPYEDSEIIETIDVTDDDLVDPDFDESELEEDD